MNRSWLKTLGGCSVLLLLSGCGGGNVSGPPIAGDTITPVLDRPIKWTAGKPAHLAVRLQAQGLGGSGPRALGFEGLPGDLAPVALVNFFDGNTPLDPGKMSLSHRC